MRTVNEAFEIFLGQLTPTSAHRLAAASHRESVDKAIEAAMPVRLSRETGSFRHGTGVRNHSDVDLMVSINRTRPDSSDTALGWIRDALKARFPSTIVKTSRPAVVIEFAGGEETWEVIPGFITTRGGAKTVYDIPGPATGWIDSAPAEHLDYVDECNAVTVVAGGAKKLARLVKAWKYYNNVPISSFYLEMRAAKHVASEKSFVPVWDICQLLEQLDNDKLAAMNDPKGVTGRFNPCSSDAKRTDALSKLSTGAKRARRALDAFNASKTTDAFDALDLLFNDKFPSKWG